jgi:hypothetical protein
MLFEKRTSKQTPRAVMGIEGHGLYSKHAQVPHRRNIRKCKLSRCKKVLSQYNHNYYCFAHVHLGAEIEARKERLEECADARARRYIRKGLKILSKGSKEDIKALLRAV